MGAKKSFPFQKIDTTSPAYEWQDRSFHQVNIMQKSTTVNKQQLQESVKENITELQDRRISVTKQISHYKVEVQDSASVPLQAYAIAGQRTPISLGITTDGGLRS